jgi:endoribonuclease Nob1
VARYVLDTSVLLGGREPPEPGCLTTPEAAAEITPGGRDARRFANWQAAGLQVRSPRQAAVERVEQTARKAGSWARLSEADRSVLALALDLGLKLLSDDHTVLDVARRLHVPAQSLNTAGIAGTLDWRPRCTGCGRWFDAAPKRGDCPVCGSAVVERVFRG